MNRVTKVQVQREFDSLGYTFNVVGVDSKNPTIRTCWTSGLNLHSVLYEILHFQLHGEAYCIFLDKHLVKEGDTWDIKQYKLAEKRFFMEYNSLFRKLGRIQ